MFEMQEEIEKSRHGKMEKLGKYIQEYTVKNKCAESIPVYSVTNTQGFCKDYFGKEVASKDKTTYKIVPKGYFAYNPSRINVGSVDWQRNEERVIVSPLYNVFSVSEQLNQQYLYYYLKSDIVRQFIKAIARGTVRDNLKLSMLCEFPIYVPSVLEQENIVVKLDGLQKVINLRKQQLQKLDELIQARFVEMFGDPVLNEKGWRRKPLLDMGNCKNGMNFHYDDCGVEINCLGVGDFKDLSIIDNTEQLPTVSLKEMPSEEYLLKDDDVVFVRSNGNKTLVGRSVAVYPGEVATTFSGFCIRYRKYDEEIRIPYLLRVLKTDSIRRKMTGRGANIQNLNQQILSNLLIPVPPIELQNQFAGFVNQVNKSKVEIQQALEKTQLLFDSLMQQYFG